MARRYALSGNATNTQSTTLPLMTLLSTANIRPKIYHASLGSGAAPVDQNAKMQMQRCTSSGTPGSNPVRSQSGL